MNPIPHNGIALPKQEPQPVLKARIGVSESVYHQQPNTEATAVDSRFSRWLENTEEQPYSRKLRVSEDWQPLDCGWITEASMMVLQNNEGRFFQVQPTEEEREEAMKRVIEVAFSSHLLVASFILPGESMRLHPAQLSSIRLRCQHGTAKCTLTLFPS